MKRIKLDIKYEFLSNPGKIETIMLMDTKDHYFYKSSGVIECNSKVLNALGEILKTNKFVVKSIEQHEKKIKNILHSKYMLDYNNCKSIINSISPVSEPNWDEFSTSYRLSVYKGAVEISKKLKKTY